ncbi:uncharacterized protein LOC123560120 isoform X2 [Mercenaria mercenaria]|uniref:uncharacterized protein LOC123560120 isoform X2 n=1 Tax=Mercenaria mercenaria TaxID=6596 RepID=UPI00234F5897|nr:uncharacterized protein LOC123560120 isoform X2 [Mercenaria mercenaria]
MERNMGPKQQPKKYLDSSKNIGGSLVKRRKGREEFSDNELISDSEDDQDDQDEQEVYFYNRHEAGNYEVKRAQPLEREAVKDDDIAGPKKKVPPKSLAEQIFTPVFMYQLYITITSVLLVNFCSVYILNNSILTTIQNGEQKLIDMDAELGKVKKAVSYEEYKYKVLQLDDIRSRIDVIQPNMFNKGCFVTAYMILIVMVLLLAVSEYNLYQRLNNDIPGRTGGRTTAKRTTCSHVFFI